MSVNVPAWLGWPGNINPPPGSGWIPGPKLRFTILGLACAFLALALTVNYAASITFFLLAILGMYVGFRRGFVNGLTRAEKLVMLAFAAYPAIAILSYTLGSQTNVGYRFLGRDLRFLLFIPVYLAIRWSRPRSRDVGFAFCVGALFCCAVAVWQFTHGIQPVGVAGVHITFGDMSLLSGVTGFALLIRGRNFLGWIGAIGAVAGLVASLLSAARGGWIAIPVLAFVLAWGHKKNMLLMGVVIVSIIVVVILSSTLLRQRISDTMDGIRAFVLYERSQENPPLCISSKQNLELIKNLAHRYGIYFRRGINGQVRVEPIRGALPGRWKKPCRGEHAIMMELPGSAEGDAKLGFRIAVSNPAAARVSALVRGKGRITLGYHSKTVAVDATRWRLATLKANLAGQTASELIVSVLPGEKVWIVPVQPAGNPYIAGFTEIALPARFEMWSYAASLFVQSPAIGKGTGSFESFLDAGIRHHRMNYLLKGYEHPHSDYLNALYSKGVSGLLTLLALFILPVFAIVTLCSRMAGESSKRMVKSIFLVALGMVVFGLSETMFAHSLVISLYAVWITVLLAPAAPRKPALE